MKRWQEAFCFLFSHCRSTRVAAVLFAETPARIRENCRDQDKERGFHSVAAFNVQRSIVESPPADPEIAKIINSHVQRRTGASKRSRASHHRDSASMMIVVENIQGRMAIDKRWLTVRFLNVARSLE